MNFPKFWALGKSGGVACWRWSSQSITEAQSLANEAAKQLAERFRNGFPPSRNAHYYPNHPFREQILQEIPGNGGLAAVVTRNAYGCQVLNTARVMFVDIDLPEPPGRRGGIGISIRIFGWPKPKPPPDMSGPRNAALEKVETWTCNNPQWGWRVYQTRAGLRLLATHAPVDAESKTAEDVFHALGSDVLYQKLCKAQKCYRARLTPKPWRCEYYQNTYRWPWLRPRDEQKFQKWLAGYEEACQDWATCSLVKLIGNATVHPEVQPIIKLHDETTRVGSAFQLA
jgi:hypothetical protein